MQCQTLSPGQSPPLRLYLALLECLSHMPAVGHCLLLNIDFDFLCKFSFTASVSDASGKKVRYKLKDSPIMRRETVRCSLPWAFIAPRTVPTTEQQMPTKAIMTMNQRMETVWETARPQQVFDSPSVVCIRPSSPQPRDLKQNLDEPKFPPIFSGSL